MAVSWLPRTRRPPAIAVVGHVLVDEWERSAWKGEIMDFGQTREERMIKRTAKEFCRNEIEPMAAELDEKGRIPDDLLKKLADIGFFGMTVPKEYGGTETGDFAHLLVIEELAYSGCPAWWPVAFNNSLPQTICRFGNTKQKEKYVQTSLTGDQLFSIQFTEPQTGSNPAELDTLARLEGNSYILNGQKRFSTFGARNGYALIWADVENMGCTCFVVEKLSKGYSAPKIWDLMGSGGVEAADIYYTDLKVPKNQVIGEVGNGFEILLYWIAIEKVQGCIAAVGLAQAALDEAVKYTKNRLVNGVPMANMQGVRSELAQIYANIQACRWLTYRTAHLLTENPSAFQKEAAACKVAVQPMMSDAISTAFRLHGGYGYTKDYKIERLYRAQPGNIVISVSLETNKAIVGSSLVK
jgi:alkylation response protein AidB-like acyl-CoA dehydrogenase